MSLSLPQVLQLLVSSPQTYKTYSLVNLVSCLENEGKILALTAEAYLGYRQSLYPENCSGLISSFFLFIPILFG